MDHLTAISSKKMVLCHHYIHVYVLKVIQMMNIYIGIFKVVVGIDLYMKTVHRMVQDMIGLA